MQNIILLLMAMLTGLGIAASFVVDVHLDQFINNLLDRLSLS